MSGGSDNHSAGTAGMALTGPLSISPPSSSSNWTAGDAVKYLSVRYVSAPYGVGMLGQSIHDAYLNMLHGNWQPSKRDSHSGVGASTVPGTRLSTRGPSTSRPTSSGIVGGAAVSAGITGGIGASSSGISTSGSSPHIRRHQIQRSMSHHNAGIPIQIAYRNEVEEFIELFEVLRDFDEQWLKQGSGGILHTGSSAWKEFIRRNRSSNQHSDDDEEAIPPELRPICDVVRVMKCCFQQLERERENLRGKVKREVVTIKHYTECVTRLDRVRKFMNGIEKLIRRSSGLAVCKNDEGIYTDLFRDFAWIFGIQFSSVTTSKPLIVRGQAVSCIPDLLYDKYTEWTIRRPENIVVITVAEVKSKASIKTTASQDHQLGKRKHSDPEVDTCNNEENENDDDACLPDVLSGQHACQLVQALTHTHVPNKNCMLGFIIQATKVRLTCLYMEKEHRENIKLPDFNPADHDATIHFTRSYDMLDAFDRGHLIQIMVKLATFGGDLG